jgi:predicted nucleotidyltransferase
VISVYNSGVKVPSTPLEESRSIHDSGWYQRDAERGKAVGALRSRVHASRPLLQQILRNSGATEAFLFGSVIRGGPRPDSDIDVAVSGCKPERFYRLAAEVERALEWPVDLVDLDRAFPELAFAIRRDGQRLLP